MMVAPTVASQTNVLMSIVAPFICHRDLPCSRASEKSPFGKHPDPSGPSKGGLVPAAGAMAALIEKASGVAPFYVGKPNALMMRTALNYLNVHSENTIMVGKLTSSTDKKSK